MATLRKYKPKNEKELHTIIEKELDSLEEGLELLKYEMDIGTGIPDFLCVDSGGRMVVICSKNNKGIVFHPVTLPKIDETLTEPTTIQDHIDYITKEDLKPTLEKIRNEIKSIGDEIKEYAAQDYIGFKFRGRQFAWITTHRKSFDLGAHIIDDKGHLLDYESIRIEDGKEDYSKIIEKIKEAYKNLGENSMKIVEQWATFCFGTYAPG